MSGRLLCHLLVFIVLTLPACTLFNPSYSEVIDQHFISNIPNSMHHVVFVYDPEGLARAWHYSGTWGQRSSTDTGDSGPPQSEALLP
jgi:hypothetical protein